jgi:hypothetical protein
LKITLALDGASISGKISASDDQGPGAAVLLFTSPKEVNMTYPDDGNYTFRGVRPSKYRVIAAQVDDDADKEKLFAAAEETYVPRQ